MWKRHKQEMSSIAAKRGMLYTPISAAAVDFLTGRLTCEQHLSSWRNRAWVIRDVIAHLPQYLAVMSIPIIVVITHNDGCRVSIAIIHVCDSVCDFVCPHDETKTAETKIAKLGTEMVRHDISLIIYC